MSKKAAARKPVAKKAVPPKVKVAAKSEKKSPGVIDRIVEVLRDGGGSIEEIAAKVAKHFPDRKVAAITGTVRVQVNRLGKSADQGGRNLRVKREEVEGGGFAYSI